MSLPAKGVVHAVSPIRLFILTFVWIWPVCSYTSLPHMPDVVAIMYHILKLAQIKGGEPSVEITDGEKQLALEKASEA